MRYFSLFLAVFLFESFSTSASQAGESCANFSGTYTLKDPCALIGTPDGGYLWELKIPSLENNWDALHTGDKVTLKQSGCSGFVFDYKTQMNKAVHATLKTGVNQLNKNERYSVQLQNSKLDIIYAADPYINPKGTRDTTWSMTLKQNRSIDVIFGDRVLFDRTAPRNGSYTYAKCTLVRN